MLPVVARRGLLHAGVLTGGLALVGLRPGLGLTAPVPESRLQLHGMLGQHVRLDLARGAVIRTADLGPALRPLQEFGAVHLPLASLYDAERPTSTGSPLQRACGAAQGLALDVAAAAWGVRAESCSINHLGIVHAASGRMIRYRAWVDVV